MLLISLSSLDASGRVHARVCARMLARICVRWYDILQSREPVCDVAQGCRSIRTVSPLCTARSRYSPTASHARGCVSSEKPQIKTHCRMPIGSGDQLVCHVILLEKQTWLNKNKSEYPGINQSSSALSQFCLLLRLGHPSLMSFDIPTRTFSSKSRNI